MTKKRVLNQKPVCFIANPSNFYVCFCIFVCIFKSWCSNLNHSKVPSNMGINPLSAKRYFPTIWSNYFFVDSMDDWLITFNGTILLLMIDFRWIDWKFLLLNIDWTILLLMWLIFIHSLINCWYDDWLIYFAAICMVTKCVTGRLLKCRF